MKTSSSWQIVLIDDEEDIREVMTLSLKDAGYRVESAADGETGLRLCKEISPRIVITDIRMPGLDGLQVLEALKKKIRISKLSSPLPLVRWTLPSEPSSWMPQTSLPNPSAMRPCILH